MPDFRTRARRFGQTILGFRASTGGNVGLTLAIAAVPLFGIVGAAVDYSRLYNAKTSVQWAMDSAVLAGTRALMEGKKKDEAVKVAEAYFTRNVEGRIDLVNENVSFSMNAKGTGIEAKGNAEMPTTLISILNFTSIPLFPKSGASASAEIAPASPGGDLEISLMLDLTGSMCDDDEGPCTSSAKLTGLKNAAKKLIDTVVWQDQTKYTSKVAIVPFSTRVRVAQDGASNLMLKLTNLAPTWSGWYKTCTESTGSGGSESGGNWVCNKWETNSYTNWKIMPCVTDRFYDATWAFDLTDKAPGSGLWLNAHDGSRMPKGPDSSAKTATTARGLTKTDPATHWNYNSDGSCADVANANQILPLTNNAATLKAKINGLEAYGGTAGVLGTAFSWYTLSPLWSSIWPSQSQPKDYSLLTQQNSEGKPKLRKVAILMTDGAYNTFRSWKHKDDLKQKEIISKNAIDMCSAMKAKNIEIYTVGFALDSLSTDDQDLAEKTLKACGTDVDHFYNSMNAQELAEAFENIGNNVAAAVRLTK